MHVTDLALTDYRSYKELVISFPRGINILVGKNGQGKTNLVEAIVYLSTFSSHRNKNDNALIRCENKNEAPPTGAILRAKVEENDYKTLIELEVIQGKPNRARLNKNNVNNKEILGKIKTIIFAPEDLQIIKLDPSVRRNFIDELATQIYPTYMGVRIEMDRVLKQRAALLKTLKVRQINDENILQIWNEKLAELFAKTLKIRMEIITKIKPLLQCAYEKVSNDTKKINIIYKNSAEKYGKNISENQSFKEIKEKYLQILDENKNREIERGINLIGTHRDDIDFYLDNLPIKGYASHGETWSSVLALKIASHELIKEIFNTDPILILDDVFAELDENRRKSIIEIMKKIEQVFITVAVENDIPIGIKAKKYNVKNIDGISQIKECE